MLRKYGLLLIILGWFSPTIDSKELTWTVTPTICITAEPDATCLMEVTVIFNASLPENYCVFEQQKLLQCNLQPNQSLTFSLAFEHETQLVVKDEEDRVVLEQSLTAKSRQHQGRRRVRQPWSLF